MFLSLVLENGTNAMIKFSGEDQRNNWKRMESEEENEIDGDEQLLNPLLLLLSH